MKMKYKSIILVLIALCALLLWGCGKSKDAVEIVNDTSYVVKDCKGYVTIFSKPPKRVLTYSMGADNMVLGFLPSDNLVAINSLCDDPVSSNFTAKAKRVKEKIQYPSIEKVLSLKPDVIFMPDWSSVERADNLRDVGLKVVVLKSARSIDDIKYNLHIVGQALHEEEKAQKLIAMMDSKFAELKERLKKINQPKKSVVLISLMKSYGGKGSVYDELCQQAGVINGISAIGLKHGESLTKELLVNINPDLLILPAYNDHGHYDTQKFIDEYLLDPALQTMKAIKTKSYYIPREGYLYNISQDCVFGAQEIARGAYGGAFAQPDNQHLSLSGEANE